jgi:hypothetical protein
MKYICEFQIPVENNEGRYYTLSTVDKASYIHDVLVKLGYSVEIISPSWAKKTVKQRKDIIGNNKCLISGFSLGWNSPITQVISRISVMIWLFFYLIKNCKRGEKVMIFHRVQNIPVFLLAKKIKRFEIILEVEELYSSLIGENNWREKFEKRIIKASKSFIFASEVLEKNCNIEHKPFAIAYGAYHIPPLCAEKRNDGKIHLVYAGLIEKDRVAFNSIRIAKYLDSNYHVHIIGYGEQRNIDLLKKEIETIQRNTKCTLTYDGLKRGSEYTSFLQSCHIGICPLTSDNRFQLACFPSKITSYLTNGLEVITTENAVLKNSRYKKFLHFAPNEKPESFAKVLKNMQDSNVGSPRTHIMKMDEEFCESMKAIL